MERLRVTIFDDTTSKYFFNDWKANVDVYIAKNYLEMFMQEVNSEEMQEGGVDVLWLFSFH